jgi:GntR family transcriptional regulator/MocR family aminotransferase
MKSSSGIELMVRLDRTSTVSLRTQLEQQLRDGVRTGTLRHDTALPSTRALAQELSVARGVVTEAYEQLAAEGYLVSRQGAPTRVAATVAPAPATTAAALQGHRWRFDFRPAAPDLSLIPRAALGSAVRQGLRDAPDSHFAYDNPQGVSELRRGLAAYLGRVRGVAATPETVLVTTGVTQGIVLACEALAELGVERVGVEDPGSVDMTGPIARLGLERMPIGVDEHGLDVEALDRSGARAVLVTPAHQYPTGVVLAPERRAALIAWATERDGFVLEDDYDAEYRYDRPPVGALQGLDPERVIYLGSVSKTLAPALRMGWLVAPAALTERILAVKKAHDRGSPVLEQLALTVLVERGEIDRHVRRSRPVYRRRRDELIRALAEHLPAIRPRGAAAGLHLLLDLPADLDEDAVMAAAAARGVGLDGLGEQRMTPGPPGLILGYGRIAEPAIDRGVARLAEAIGAVTRGSG